MDRKSRSILLISPDGWIYFPQPRNNACLRLFCFPGSGAQASLFFPWAHLFPETIEVGAIQPPGRTPELDFGPDVGYATVVKIIADAIAHYHTCPIAFFGHSMGALLAFEVARSLSQQAAYPQQVLLACCPPPHLLSQVLFIKGSASAGMAHFFASLQSALSMSQEDEQQRKFTSLTQYDIRLWRDYRYQRDPYLTCPLTIYGGTHDQFLDAQLLSGWQTYINTPQPDSFKLEMWDGDHFFFYTNPQPLIQTITSSLLGHTITEKRRQQ